MPQKPFGMVFLQHRTPARMIDDYVQENASPAQMGFIREFLKLLDAGCPLIKHHQGRVNSSQIQCSVRTANPPKSRVRRRRGVNGEQMEDFAAECLRYMR